MNNRGRCNSHAFVQDGVGNWSLYREISRGALEEMDNTKRKLNKCTEFGISVGRPEREAVWEAGRGERLRKHPSYGGRPEREERPASEKLPESW